MEKLFIFRRGPQKQKHRSITTGGRQQPDGSWWGSEEPKWAKWLHLLSVGDGFSFIYQSMKGHWKFRFLNSGLRRARSYRLGPETVRLASVSSPADFWRGINLQLCPPCTAFLREVKLTRHISHSFQNLLTTFNWPLLNLKAREPQSDRMLLRRETTSEILEEIKIKNSVSQFDPNERVISNIGGLQK